MRLIQASALLVARRPWGRGYSHVIAYSPRCRPDWRAVGFTRSTGSYPSQSEGASDRVEPLSPVTGMLTYHQHQFIMYSGSHSLPFQRSTGSPTPSFQTTDFAKRGFSTNQASFSSLQRPTASPTPNWRAAWTKHTKVCPPQ